MLARSSDGSLLTRFRAFTLPQNAFSPPLSAPAKFYSFNEHGLISLTILTPIRQDNADAAITTITSALPGRYFATAASIRHLFSLASALAMFEYRHSVRWHWLFILSHAIWFWLMYEAKCLSFAKSICTLSIFWYYDIRSLLYRLLYENSFD